MHRMERGTSIITVTEQPKPIATAPIKTEQQSSIAGRDKKNAKIVMPKLES